MRTAMQVVVMSAPVLAEPPHQILWSVGMEAQALQVQFYLPLYLLHHSHHPLNHQQHCWIQNAVIQPQSQLQLLSPKQQDFQV